MFASLPFKSASAVAAIAAAGMLVAPGAASAQSYTYQGAQAYGGYDQRYDPYGQSSYGYDRYGQAPSAQAYCRTDTNQRRGAGATFGAVLGAVAGSQLGARGRRTEGSVLGGVVGAAIGAAVGDSTARCDDRTGYGYGYDDRRYSQNAYGYPVEPRYDDRGYGYDSYGDDRYAYDRSTAYADDRYGYQGGCRTIETRSRDWNGRIVTRYEQSCPTGY